MCALKRETDLIKSDSFRGLLRRLCSVSCVGAANAFGVGIKEVQIKIIRMILIVFLRHCEALPIELQCSGWMYNY